MSTDLSRLIHHPDELFWQEHPTNESRQNLRLLDPPLLHYAAGIGLRLAGLSSIAIDWNWHKSWAENQAAGAIPSAQLLLAGRMVVAALFPFSLALFYLTVRRFASEFAAWVAVLLLASNMLILLHTRRLMAEGILVFTLILTLWFLVNAEKHPWLAAIPAALAFTAKASLAPLTIAGFLAVFWRPGERFALAAYARRSLLFGLIFTGILFLLFPIAWKQPIQALQAAVAVRQKTIDIQVGEYSQFALKTPGEKLASLFYQVYYAPPMFSEDNRYQAGTVSEEEAYLSNPIHTLFRSIVAGSLLLAFSVFGFIAGIYQAAHSRGLGRRRFTLLLAATLLQGAALLVMIPLAWQRYYMPLVPFSCLWAAYGADQIKELASRVVIKRVSQVHVAR